MSRGPFRTFYWPKSFLGALIRAIAVSALLLVGWAWLTGRLTSPMVDVEQRRRGNLIHLKLMLVEYLDRARERPEMLQTGAEHPLVAVVRSHGPYAYLLVSPLVKVVPDDFSFRELTADMVSYETWELEDLQRLRDFRKSDPAFNPLQIWETVPGPDGTRYAVVDLVTVLLTQEEFEKKIAQTAALLLKLRVE